MLQLLKSCPFLFQLQILPGHLITDAANRMSRAPACHFGINIFCRNYFVFIIAMYNRLFRRHEYRSGLHRFRAQHHSGGKAPAVRNPSGSHDRYIHRIHHLRHQSHCSCRTDMASGFRPFRHNRVRPCTLHHLCHSHAGNYRNDFHSCLFPHSHEFTRIARTGSNHLYALFHHNPGNVFRIGIQQHNIHTHRLIGQLLSLPYLLPDHLRRCAGRAD